MFENTIVNKKQFINKKSFFNVIKRITINLKNQKQSYRKCDATDIFVTQNILVKRKYNQSAHVKANIESVNNGLEINTFIESCLNNTNRINNVVKAENLNTVNMFLPSTLFIQKANLLKVYGYEKQSFYALKNLLLSQKESLKWLWKKEGELFDKSLGLSFDSYFEKENLTLNIFYNELSRILFNESNFVYENEYVVNKKLREVYTQLLLKQMFLNTYNTIISNQGLGTESFPLVSYMDTYHNVVNPSNIVDFTLNLGKVKNTSKLDTLWRKYYTAFLKGSFFSTKISSKFYSLKQKSNVNGNKSNRLRSFIWKRNGLSLREFYVLEKTRNNSFFGYHKPNSRRLALWFFYLVERLQENAMATTGAVDQSTEDLVLLLLNLWEKKFKFTKGKGTILSTLGYLREIKQKGRGHVWKKLFYRALLEALNENLNNNPSNKKKALFKTVYKNLLTKLNNTKQLSNSQELTLSKFNKNLTTVHTWRKPLKVRQTFNDKKLALRNAILPAKGEKEFFSLFTKNQVNLFFINALSLAKFAYRYENTKRQGTKVLNNIERNLINKYKYIGIYIQDLVRIAFVSMFLKNPSFLASFIAYQIEKLPRNRKETKFIRFVVKTIKMFSSLWKKILGLRIRVKGRVNRWRRTKVIQSDLGTLPLHRNNIRIDYGSAKAITRKGALGIGIWIRYHRYYHQEINKKIQDYIKYSIVLKKRLLRRAFKAQYGHSIYKSSYFNNSLDKRSTKFFSN